MIPSAYFDTIQKACLPGIWSRGVSLARGNSVVPESIGEEEILLKVRAPDHPVSRRVTLWPQEEDWYCDCDAKPGTGDVCMHVAAAVIALKSGNISTQGQIIYRFSRQEGALTFDRWIQSGSPGSPGFKEELLKESLVSYVGGISSGRIRDAIPVIASKEDFSVDSVLNQQRRGLLDPPTLAKLICVLAECSKIELDNEPITTSSKPLQLKVQLREEQEGFRLSQVADVSVTETFKNGAALCGKVLKGIETVSLTEGERAALAGEGKVFLGSEIATLVTDLLPALQKKLPVEILTSRLPLVKRMKPKIVLNLEEQNEVLTVVPRIVYGAGNTNPFGKNAAREISLEDPAEERRLARQLQTELQLSPGQRVTFQGEAALDFCLRLSRIGDWEIEGQGAQAFAILPSNDPLEASLLSGDTFQLSFESRATGKRADPQRVLRAWVENQSYVPLLGGGWARLPKDWLNRYGERITALLAAREESPQKELPSFFLPELADLCETLGKPCPPTLSTLRENLKKIDQIETAPLPSDLRAELRHYQQSGVNWLSFLRQAGMGAMLADDMGLGKTLQALCSIQGRTLVVAPTSVLHSWADQMEKFRPSLRFSVYHGISRSLDMRADVIVTSYGILRLDREILGSQEWDSIILDEAQTIKNPESQIAKAAHSLLGKFKIALSGTPIENRMEDLWSQFQFLNPGLFGSRETFQSEYAAPIARGDSEAAEALRKRIRPFILRRLKKEVAPELPPRTETVLYCELSQEEREIYESILASTRQEVVEKLQTGGSVFAALELLLRLRQACCHPALIPGAAAKTASGTSSSKVSLLIETLEESIDFGHRSLVFSQWTSFLDLMEPALQAKGIRYLRLDGSTRNRQEVVERFQTDESVDLMLISLKAGGVGLTLTAADHIFLMDPWWNPAVEDQAADRAHRIGQTNPVLIHRLVAENTIEDRILALQKSKVALAETLLSGASAAAAITREDLLSLLT